MQLELLPPELLSIVAARCSPVSLLDLALASRRCCAVAEDDSIWKLQLTRSLQSVAEAFFEGILPSPESQTTWKRHYFALHRTWKKLAQERTGRLLVQISAQEMCGRRPNELDHFLELTNSWWHWGIDRPPTYGVYDVTDFITEHPGSDLIIDDAANMADASSVFEMAAHSDLALRRLATLAVPGLEALPFDQELEQLRTRRSAWSRQSWLTLAQGIVVAACFACFFREHPQFLSVPIMLMGWLACVACVDFIRARGRRTHGRRTCVPGHRPEQR